MGGKADLDPIHPTAGRDATSETADVPISGRLERALPWLFAAAVTLGVAAPAPGREVGDHGGIEVALAVLVLAAALAIPMGGFRRVAIHGRVLATVTVATATLLPALAWSVSRLVPPGDLRHGVLALGVAPVEVAAVAITSLVGGAVAATAVLLVTSTLVAVMIAGPVLELLASGAAAAPVEILVDLAVVVAAPLAVGLLLRHSALGPFLSRVADGTAVLAVTVLAWLVASQIELSSDYLPVGAAIALFLAGSIGFAWLVAHRAPAVLRSGLATSVSMRDFAVAAGIATAAFGPRAAGPLGLYGIAVLAWGALVTRYPKLTGHPVAPAAESTADRAPSDDTP